ncbi:TPM domain-containing protein [Microbacterium sp.]|uniref:TPM domain-containing protein n=1 Tax=Microbacterium sp. TaxID=51671 RepID=UPI003A8B07D1
MRRGWIVVLAVLAMIAAGPAGAAWATDPLPLGAGYVLDDADVLTAAEEAQAQQRLEQLRSDTGVDLWVVFIDTFSGASGPEDWANTVAEQNGLGPTQYLLAVAVEGRQYYLSADSAGPLSNEQILTIEQQRIQPPLRELDWMGAVDGAAAGITDAAGGGSGAGGGAEGGANGFLIGLLVVVIIAVAIVIVVIVVRSRRKSKPTTAAESEQLPIAELERRAGSALVAMDDAIRTSQEELGFATAEFGEAATTEFATALGQARKTLDQAFALRQQLDDATPDTDEQVRAWNRQIVQLCSDAGALLDEKAAAFDELRRLEQNAPEALARVQEVRATMSPRIDEAAASLSVLAARYVPTALATVADNPEQARQRLAFADEQLAAAQQNIGAGRGGEAAVSIRAAEEAVDQAAQLSAAVGTVGTDLAAAERAIDDLVANLTQDVAAASAMPDESGALAPVVAAAQQAIATATAAAPPLAPFRVLETLEGANTQIDAVVAGVRDRQEAARRAEQQLGQVMLQARGQVSAAEDYITTRRGAVGATARTRLAEAGASLVHAQQLQASDPAQALAQAQRANQLAGQAIQSAQTDVGSFSGGGSLGGSGSNMLGAVLGGIVINSMLGGGGGGRRRGHSSGMFGGGMSGGGRRSSGRSSGSFGGGGTRSRRGGGRF